MSTGLYGWIREGVKRAVLLGVSDAVEQLGTPDGQEINPQLLSVLRTQNTPLLGTSQPAAASKPAIGIQSRKRLGRSIGQVQPASSPAAS